jgi:hypothetical protein
MLGVHVNGGSYVPSSIRRRRDSHRVAGVGAARLRRVMVILACLLLAGAVPAFAATPVVGTTSAGPGSGLWGRFDFGPRIRLSAQPGSFRDVLRPFRAR